MLKPTAVILSILPVLETPPWIAQVLCTDKALPPYALIKPLLVMSVPIIVWLRISIPVSRLLPLIVPLLEIPPVISAYEIVIAVALLLTIVPLLKMSPWIVFERGVPGPPLVPEIQIP